MYRCGAVRCRASLTLRGVPVKRPFLWRTVTTDDGETWPVYLTTKALTPCLRRTKERDMAGRRGPFAGMTDWRKRRVWIDIERPPHVIVRTFVHEALHVALKDVALPAEWEEQLVVVVSQQLVAILQSAGVELPAVPKKRAVI
jgi:hypothetical protein